MERAAPAHVGYWVSASARSINAVRYILIAIALLGTAVLLWRLAQILAVAFGGVVVATLLIALAKPFGRIRWVGERMQMICGLIAFFGIVGLLIWLFGHQVSAQAAEMQRLLPEQLRRTGAYLDRSAVGRFVVKSFQKSADGFGLSGVGLAASALFSAVLDIVLIVFLGVFFAWDPEMYVNGGLRLIPPARRKDVRDALLDAGSALRSWLMGQLISMGIIGALAGIAYAIIGMPVALALGCLAALFEFIPVAGPLFFGGVAILVGFSKGPRLAFSAVVVFAILQQIESNVIIPLVQRWAARLPPALTILSVLAGGLLLGPVGIVFAVPLTVVVMNLIKHLYVEETLES